MNAIDWSQMYWVKDDDGHKVMHLPIQSLIFEEQLNRFNDKKDILQRKYHRIVSSSQEQCERMIRLCLKNSVEVNTKLLDLGINLNQPQTKSRHPELDLLDEPGVLDSLSRWVTNPHYVEAWYVKYNNDQFNIYIDSTNTTNRAWIPELERRNGEFYWPGGGQPDVPIEFIGHTHRYSPTPSAQDTASYINGLNHTIFFNGSFHQY
ncbi:MAG: hypothetical protein K2G93_08795 [Rikenella sp.]|nr:hypothetical protein [Rikenella sp.]